MMRQSATSSTCGDLVRAITAAGHVMGRTPRSPGGTGLVVLFAAGLLAWVTPEGRAAELRVGGATTSITPDRPVALAGQMHTRIAREVESPVTATALALESRQGDRVLDQAILVSCDLVAIGDGIIEPGPPAPRGPDPRLRRPQARPQRHAHPHRAGDAGRGL